MPVEDSAQRRAIRPPILSFSSDGIVYALDSLDTITRCTNRGLESGFYKKLLLIDADGRAFRVVDARRVRKLPPRNFGQFLGFIFGNPRWQVELELEPRSSKASLDEIKRLISNSFEKDSTW